MVTDSTDHTDRQLMEPSCSCDSMAFFPLFAYCFFDKQNISFPFLIYSFILLDKRAMKTLVTGLSIYQSCCQPAS